MFTNDENVSKTFVNFRLITFIVLSLILGISVSYFMLMGKTFYAVFFAVLFVTALLLYFAINFSKNVLKIKVTFSTIFIFAFIVGFILFNLQVTNYSDAGLGYKTQNVTATVNYVEEISNGQKLDLTDVAISGIGKLEYNMELRVYGEGEYRLGDRINFTARLSDKEIIYDGRFKPNDVVDKIKYSAFVYDKDVILIENKATMFQKVNTFIKNTLKSGMSEESFPIAYALLTGGSETIDEEVITTFRNTGVAHIFAVSGLHIGFLATALSILFKKLRINGFVKTVVISLILFFYSGVCGFSASSIRACIMCTVMILTSVTGHKYDGLTSVSLAGVIILVFSPVQLFCVGFQLSFAVVTGILTLTPSITKLLRFLPYKLSSSLATVLSAQISGVPILLYAFHKFSSVSIIVNLLFIPVVGVLFVGLLVLLVLGAMFSITKITLFLPDVAFKTLTFLIKFFDKEFFLIGGFTLGIFALAYLLFFLVWCGFFNLKRITATILCIILGLTCVVGVTVKSLIPDGERVYVSGSDNFCFSVFANDDEGVLIVSKITQNSSLSRLCRIITLGEVENIDTIIFTKQQNVTDFSQVAVRLLTTTNANAIYYFGEENDLAKTVINSAYPKVVVKSYNDNTPIITLRVNFTSELDGKCIWFVANGKSVGVFSEFDNKNPNYHGLNKKFDLVVLTNYLENLEALYSSSLVVSYAYNSEYVNAENYGNIKYYL